MKKQFAEVADSWNWFWFDSKSNDSLTAMSLFRVCFGVTMLFFYFTRAFDVEYYYSDTGLMPSAYRDSLDAFRYHPTLLTGISSAALLHVIHGVFLLSIFLLTIGAWTRITSIVTFVLHIMFINRNMAVTFGVDMIGTFYFLYLCFANANAHYSLDDSRGKAVKKQTLTGHIAWRLMQLQVCVIYGFSGLEKLKGTRWWDGSALWDVLSMGTMQRWDFSFVAHTPLLLSAGVYVVLFWEIYFPVLVWVPKLRLPMLFFGLIMHLGIFLFLNLPTFGCLMITCYILFLKKDEIKGLLRFLRIAQSPHA